MGVCIRLHEKLYVSKNLTRQSYALYRTSTKVQTIPDSANFSTFLASCRRLPGRDDLRTDHLIFHSTIGNRGIENRTDERASSRLFPLQVGGQNASYSGGLMSA
jgi:hypothetical protein